MTRMKCSGCWVFFWEGRKKSQDGDESESADPELRLIRISGKRRWYRCQRVDVGRPCRPWD